VLVWLVANLKLFGAAPYNFPAEPWSQRKWFFNPLGWQLIFFTGFAFMSGWIKPPPIERKYIVLAVAIVIVTLPFAYFRIYNARPDWILYSDLSPWFKEQRSLLAPLISKSQFGVLRYVHFLATAYLAWVAVGPMGSRLKNWGSAQFVVNTIRRVGQQSLAVFVSSLVIAQIVGMGFRVMGTHWVNVTIGNILGFLALIGIAHAVAWFKSHPWRQPAPTASPNPAMRSGSTSLPMGVPARRID